MLNPQDSSFARTTISMPRSLKRRMKALGTRVNWSAVACEAFEAKLAELGEPSGAAEVNSIEEAVERMRRMQASPNTDSYRLGCEQGRRWAMSAAAPDQLQRLENFRQEMSDDAWRTLWSTERGWRQLTMALLNEHSAGKPCPRLKAFWREVVGDLKGADGDFFGGFAEGALDVWRQVKTRL